MSRDIGMFEKPYLITEFIKICAENGIPVFVTNVDRSYKEQYAYFLQNREPLFLVNQARKLAGLSLITQLENRRCVTWTMNSEHVVNPDDDKLTNDKSRAFDFAIKYGGEVVWDLKADVNKDNIADYEQCADIAEGLGMFSGRRFKHPDYPHIQLVAI